jgi:hypothetical protein
MSTGGFTAADVQRQNAKVAKGLLATDRVQAPKASKYRAEPCIVTEDLTLFTRSELRIMAKHPAPSLSLVLVARQVGVVGEFFPSLKEGRRYIELAHLLAAGAVRGLTRQVRFPLIAGPNITIGHYVADFVYDEQVGQDWVSRIEDAKGMRTPVYKWKTKHFSAQYGIKIRET